MEDREWFGKRPAPLKAQTFLLRFVSKTEFWSMSVRRCCLNICPDVLGSKVEKMPRRVRKGAGAKVDSVP